MDNKLEQILKTYSEAKNKILLYVEAAVSPEQFKALRKLILNELGRSGAEGKLRELFNKQYHEKCKEG